MTSLLPILPILLLALFCAVAGSWSLREVDRLLTDDSASVHPNQSESGSDTEVRLPR